MLIFFLIKQAPRPQKPKQNKTKTLCSDRRNKADLKKKLQTLKSITYKPTLYFQETYNVFSFP